MDEYGADIMRLWALSDYTEDHRIGKEILKGVADQYRKLRNTFRYLLGALDGLPRCRAGRRRPRCRSWNATCSTGWPSWTRSAQGRCGLRLQQLCSPLSHFCNEDLSAFFFDIRKDCLYCDAPTEPTRRSAIAPCSTCCSSADAWLAPVLVFTTEEVWLARFPSEDGSVHLQDMPGTPADWLDESLAAKWAQVRQVRRVVTAALEVQRTAKVIGASLEAAPVVHVEDAGLLAMLRSVDFADLCITSGIVLTGDPAPRRGVPPARSARCGRGVRTGRRRQVPALLEDPAGCGQPRPRRRLRPLRQRAGLMRRAVLHGPLGSITLSETAGRISPA